jgi:hypothetical protein
MARKREQWWWGLVGVKLEDISYKGIFVTFPASPPFAIAT